MTTEKDFMRLKNQLPAEKIYYLPIEVKILNEVETFEKTIKRWI